MKDVIATALQKGFFHGEVSVVGLLVEGEHCTIQVMQSPSKVFYTMYKVSEFKLPKDQDDLKVLVGTETSFELCRALILQAAEQTNVEPQKQILNVICNSFSPPHHAEYFH
ncbi:hypothetical protein MAM1_0102d05273 [Mucor ambiguus]|uniref:Proteasome assembly chaperone 3 n=1 Tax=Mucor ambiguus TaxID=91626 RepID=A0A0C9MUQ1_9FUNG|nr:hypothetical protein MAM1_0102d05273 [Mucor ambiguus]